MRTACNTLLLVTLLMLAHGPRAFAFGQIAAGTIVGTVSDEKGAVMPGASVTLTNTQTGLVRAAATDESGNYLVAYLPAGVYSLGVELRGFKREVRNGVTLNAGQKIREDFTLNVGETSEVVEVKSEAPLIRSETSEMGAVFDARRVSELPLNGRNFVQLVTLTTGTATGVPGQTLKGSSTIGFRSDTAVTASSGRAAENNFILDGVDNNEADLGSIVIIPIIDGIEEFKVLTSTFSAEYGRTSGAVISVQTRSGTNHFHGTLFEFHRNSAFDAKNFFDLPERKTPHFILHQFGGAVGGPIKKERTFFFGVYQGTRIRQAQTFVTTVPTEALRRGDFNGTGVTVRSPLTGLPFPENVIPGGVIDPAARALLNSYPLPNRPGLINNFVNNPILRRRDEQFDVRLDHTFAARNSLFVRYSFNDTDRFLPSQLTGPTAPGGGGSGTITGAGQASLLTQGAAVNHTYVISPKLINNFIFGFTRFDLNNVPEGFGEDLAEQFGIPGVNINLNSTGLPRIVISGYAGLGPSAFLPNFSAQNMFQAQNHLNRSAGRHNLRFGFDFRRRQRNNFGTFFQQGQFVFNPTFTGHSFASFLTGYPSSTVRTILDGTYGRRSWEAAAYVQDDINLSRHLKLNLGLRYEVWSPVTEVADRQANFDPRTGRMILASDGGPLGRGLRRYDLNNFGPRVGFAYDPSGVSRTVIRAGFGVSFLEDGGQVVQLNLADNYPFSFTQALVAFGRPLNRLGEGLPIPFAPDPRVPGGNIKYIDPDFKTAYTQMWNLNLQQRLGGGLFAEVAYAGSQAVKLRSSRNINQPIVGTGPAAPRRPFFRLNPNLGDVIGTFSDAQANYHSLQAKLTGQFSGGLNFLANYTFSKSITNHEAIAANSCDSTFGANPRDARSDRSVSCSDMPHRLTFSFGYKLPFGNSLLGAGWQVNGIITLRSGTPFTPQLAAASPVTGAVVRPDRICDGALPAGRRTRERYFDVQCFKIPDASVVYGNSGRNILRAPGQANADLSVFKELRLRDDWRLQFRTEVFNLFNTPQFGIPVRFIDTPEAGSIQETLNTSRQIQFALKMYF